MMETVWDVVAAQAQRTPQAIAVKGGAAIAEDGELSYEDFAKNVSKLAEEIHDRTEPGRIVAFEVSRPVSAAVVVLAAARCHCPVLPLSPDSPPLHRTFVLEDARPALMIRELSDGGLIVANIDVTEGAEAATADPEAYDLKQAAYVMYTSGSTGRPKGVVVPHDALVSRLAALAAVPGFGPQDSIIAMTAPSFDISMAELLVPLTVGGCLVSAPVGARIDPAVFAATVEEHQPTVIQATPSFWRLALAWGWPGALSTRLWCGGEALTPSLADGLTERCAELWNLYGPTEATIWATAARIRADEPVRLGAPLPGAGLCLEDDHGRLVEAPDRPGEILLYGEGLALGYLNRAELTAERFRTCDTPAGPRRCYRTGDRAQYREDGSLQFLGRTDGQIKLRGNRIELAELEAVAEGQPGVRETAAILRDPDTEDAHIALFVVTDGTLSTRDIRRWLAERLPQAMRPSGVVIESALPRTSAGKVDRVRLVATRRG